MTSRRAARAASPARVVVHDFSGHPFQVQLARHLAGRVERCTHLYCSSFLTPRGAVEDRDGAFASVGIRLRRPFNKYSGLRRLAGEIEYGWRAARQVRRESPDVVISANVPLLAATIFQLAMLLSRIPVVFWQQDVYSFALAEHLRNRGGRIRRFAAAAVIQAERWMLRTSQAVVVISPDFLDVTDSWGIDRSKVHVIENWAPLEELPECHRRNDWSRRHGIGDDDLVFLYSGTLGLKHDPSILLDLAKAFSDRPDVHVIVASEGRGAEWIAEHATDADGIEQLPFQPYADMPEMLATADVLIVLLEPHAGVFSVPSKVLTYQCAGRAILAAMPLENLASRNLQAAGAGVVVPPGSTDAFVAAALELAAAPDARAERGRNARAYAERVFDIEQITDRFESIIEGVAR